AVALDHLENGIDRGVPAALVLGTRRQLLSAHLERGLTRFETGDTTRGRIDLGWVQRVRELLLIGRHDLTSRRRRARSVPLHADTSLGTRLAPDLARLG